MKINHNERNYHIFYQLLRGASENTRRELLLDDRDVEDFRYTMQGNDTISGVSDSEEWHALIESFNVVGFSDRDQMSVLRTIAAVLHLGNVTVSKESASGDQASLNSDAVEHASKACKLLGIPVEPFVQALLHPRVKAGREWVQKAQTPEQVRLSIDALCKGIYERGFGSLVDRMNHQLNLADDSANDTHFVGVLDIAGFEIFETNSFEQLCINYTNEKLQQFFNHHMFVLEQEEYAREQIEWNFIDFGRDLQPTIDLIEVSNPIGIFSCLDEDSVMPKATDKTFTEKLHSLWDRKSPKYRRPMLNQGFMITHYAADVEYSTEGWLDKNRDPLNDNATKLLACSSDKHIAKLFADCADVDDEGVTSKTRIRKGLFRTVAQRHKEQLSGLMRQLHSTHPHFVRCILPNHKKRPKLWDTGLVLDQLRCNGVLEGIRIARTGFPNRIPFAEFRSRYEVLCSNVPKGVFDGQEATKILLERLSLDPSYYRVGITKVFFRAGVLAELEEQRDSLIREIMSRFQSVARGFTQRRAVNKRLYRAEAARIIHQNFKVYLNLQTSPWWRLFVRMRPLLGATRQAGELKKRDEMIQQMEQRMLDDATDRQRVEDDRRRAEKDILEVQKTLENERALALDKEEIFKRLQERESELSEKLAGAIDDQETLEDQMDEILDAKKRVEQKVASLQSELEQAGSIIGNLESEKQDLVQSMSDLEEQLVSLQESRSQTSEKKEQLDHEIRVLNSQLSMKDRKIADLESKIVKSDQDVAVKLAETTKELQSTKKRATQLSEEKHTMQQQLAQLSSSSTEYEDRLRLKASEMSIVKDELKQYQSDRQRFDEENRKLSVKHDQLQGRMRDAQAELDAMRSRQSQLEREASDAKRVLQERLDESAISAEERKAMEDNIEDLKEQLYEVQTELTRERQSRDDVQMLSEHNLSTLKRDYDALNQAKITIEKELYAQQDVLRRTSENRNKADNERKSLQDELRSLRQRYLELQEARLEAQSEAERSSNRLASERQAALKREIQAKEDKCNELEDECDQLNAEVQRLKQVMADSEDFKIQHDQSKERLERELVTVKGRLTASENDNKALLNKVQQKNLDIARSNSRAGDSQRSRLVQLQNERNQQTEENKNLSRQLEEAKFTITSLEQQKQKMSLNLEDLNHEVSREHKASRTAEKNSSAVGLQLAEVNRKLETERQLKTQAQANSRMIQSSLDRANQELTNCHGQLMLLQKVFDPKSGSPSRSFESVKPDISKTIDLAHRLEDAQHVARVATEKCAHMESQMDSLRNRHEDEMSQMDARYSSSKRAMLEEIDQNQVTNNRRSPVHNRYAGRENTNNRTPNGYSTPVKRNMSHARSESEQSDKTVDSESYNKKMDLISEVEMLQNQLQMSEMRVRHLQDQVDRSPAKQSWQDESPSVRRVQRLEKENFRLHDMLDDSAKKVSVLENSIRTGQLTLKDVQTKSHEELYDLISSQEQSRRSLLQVHNTAVSDLADAKEAFDDLKHAKATTEFELRDAHSELEELRYEHEQEASSREQLLQEFSELQIKFDNETSTLDDVRSSLEIYRKRADEYYNKLEQAEMAVLRASRAEQFAKTQGREAEDTCANILSERKHMDSLVEDLQRQVQNYEERVEDMSADLDGALQSKKRLQNELEDYRSQRAMDLEDQETTVEQTRRKYQNELAMLNDDLDGERENLVVVRGENGRLRDELEELRSKWDDEVLNSSTWAKEKSRLEMTLESLSNSRDEAADAHNEAQSKVVSLLSQVRSLRSDVDEAAGERDGLAKEKKTLEARLSDANARLEELSKSDSPSMRNAASTDRELLRLNSDLAAQEDIASAAVGKMRRSDILVAEIQKDVTTEREANMTLHKEKTTLEKNVKDLQLRLVDLETKGFSSASGDVRFLHGRVQELEKQLETLESSRQTEARDVRNVDRTVRDLQSQIERRDKAVSQLNEDINKSRDKSERLLSTIDELQKSESDHQLVAKRAERELRDEKEKSLRLERELEGWKGLRVEKENAIRRSGTFRPGGGGIGGGGSEAGSARSRAGLSTRGASVEPGGGSGVGGWAGNSTANGKVEIPQRKSSLTKGFL